jgi:catechol 2,3-dioxygenase-like lactoylglutathione lyase family enzyme
MQPAILETALYCDDLSAARKFYGDKLELEVIAEVEGRHVFFQLNGSVLLVFNPGETAKPSSAGLSVPSHGANGPGHACFSTAPQGYEFWLGKLRSLGIEIETEIVWPGGARSFYFRDPAGNSLEFGEPKLWEM